MDGQLSEGRHTVIIVRRCWGGGCLNTLSLFTKYAPSRMQMHHPLAMSVLDEHPQSPRWRDLRAVLTAHGNVRLVLSGHCHKASWRWCLQQRARGSLFGRPMPASIHA